MIRRPQVGVPLHLVYEDNDVDAYLYLEVRIMIYLKMME